jgi:hypothetical protein
VAAIVVDCTDTAGPVEPGVEKEPWLLRKTRYLASLEEKPQTSLLVTAADKAHNARDLVLDARSNPNDWERFTAGLEGSAWYLLRVQQALSHRLPESRSTALLAEAVQELLSSEPYRRLVPHGIAPAVWPPATWSGQRPIPSLERPAAVLSAAARLVQLSGSRRRALTMLPPPSKARLVPTAVSKVCCRFSA